MSAHYPHSRYNLPPITENTVIEEVAGDTSEKRAMRANLVYQASRLQPEIMQLHSPGSAGLLLRHAISVVESYQNKITVKEVVGDVYCPTKTIQLRQEWKTVSHWPEAELKECFDLWWDLSVDSRKKLMSLWWRSDTGKSGYKYVTGIADHFFSTQRRNIHEGKMVRAMTQRVLESFSLLMNDGEFHPEYVDYLVCLAWRESQVRQSVGALLNQQR